MKAIATFLPAAALAAALMSSAAPASAAVFADFTPDSRAMDYRWINNGVSNTGTGGHFFSLAANNQNATSPAGANTHFQFLDPGLTALGFIPATFMLDATAVTTPATVNGSGVVSQTDISGNFSFVYRGATTANYNGSGITLTHGENLLSGVFTNAFIQGAGGSGSFNLAHTNSATLTFTSALINFAGYIPSTEEFAWNLLSAKPNFARVPGDAMSSFVANGGGNFAALPVPEPAAWALMIVGFGGLGVMARRRRVLAAA
jgi:hypothetical protein